MMILYPLIPPRATRDSPKEIASKRFPTELGRSYRLRLIDSDPTAQPPLVLRRGWFELSRQAQGDATAHFTEWYTCHGEAWITRQIALISARLGVSARSVSVRAPGHRWGACTPEGKLLFYWRVTLLPARVAEYIILHEIAHLMEPKHGAAFWQILAQAMPDHQARKEWLALYGSQYNL